MHDVIVVDEEYRESSSRFSGVCSRIDTLVDRYIGLMDQACRVALKSGAAADALRVYTDYARTLKSAARIIAEANNDADSTFLSAIDQADSYLF